MAELTVIVPCFNEAARLPTAAFEQAFAQARDRRWILVDDGSSDATLDLLRTFEQAHSNVQVVCLPQNMGKAEAVRVGVLHALAAADCDWVAYLDADLATPVEELARIFARHRASDSVSVVLGSRIRRLGASIERKMLRHYFGRCAATAISLLLGLPTYDTQCGAKLFRRQIAEQIFAAPFVSRWLFDAELIARYRNLVGQARLLSSMIEEPLEVWLEKPGSKLRPVDLFRLPHDLWRLHRHYNGRPD